MRGQTKTQNRSEDRRCMIMAGFRFALTTACLAICLSIFTKYFEHSLPLRIEGHCAKGWEEVCDTFKSHIDSGWQSGGGFSVYHQGALVVNMVGGYADTDSELPWSTSTVSQYYSTTKGPAAVVMAMLVDRGLLDYKKRVAEYWPEFGGQGKRKIIVEQLLSHQGGLAAIDEPFSVLSVKDEPDQLEEIIANQKPHWPLGDGVGYHGYTLGLYQNALVKRVDPKHRSISQYFEEEIAKPLGIDFYIGLPYSENYRCAKDHVFPIFSWDTLTATRYYPSIWAALTDSSSLISKVLENPQGLKLEENPGKVNNPHIRAAPSPSTAGFGTVESLARLFGFLARWGHGSSRGDEEAKPEDAAPLLSEEAIQNLNKPIASGMDKVLLLNITYGLGVTLFQAPHGGYTFGAPGAGGQMAYADPKYELGWSYLTNYQSVHAIGDDPKYLELREAMYKCASELQ